MPPRLCCTVAFAADTIGTKHHNLIGFVLKTHTWFGNIVGHNDVEVFLSSFAAALCSTSSVSAAESDQYLTVGFGCAQSGEDVDGGFKFNAERALILLELAIHDFLGSEVRTAAAITTTSA